MIRSRHGYSFFNDDDLGQEMAIIYAPVRSANYSMAMVIPKDQIMAPVKNLRWFFLAITLASITLSMTVSLILAKRVTRPVDALSKAAKELAIGSWQTRLTPRGSDEVSELARTFNEMAGSLEIRDVDASVNGGALDISLLGMTFLGRLERYEIEGDKLIFSW